jgi:hypothetical protein
VVEDERVKGAENPGHRATPERKEQDSDEDA